jgi:hypothetical protein
MTNKKTIIPLITLLAIGISCCLLISCKKNSLKGMIVISRLEGEPGEFNFTTGDSWRYIPHAQIVALNPENPGKSIKILTENFYSARSPQVSYDGNSMLFAGQLTEDDPWQIWEMSLENFKVRQITKAGENCIDPAYLPGGRMVFSKLMPDDSLRSGHTLFTCNLDGSDMRRITFNPDTYFASGVLQDGRILAISRQVYPDMEHQIFTVLRPDGTKANLFYQGADKSKLLSRAWETPDGRVVFIESVNGNNNANNLISISYNNPMQSKTNLSSGIKGEFNSVFPRNSGKLLVSYREPGSGSYGLYEFDPESKVVGHKIYNDENYNILEAVAVEEHSRPKILPSAVVTDIKVGLFMCQDINITDRAMEGNPLYQKKAVKIEILGIDDESYGIVNVDEDGSFYLKSLADMPIRIRTLDKDNNVINGPCSWIYIRPNERRGCVGCHENHDLVPENRIPLAVKKSPVIIPVHIEHSHKKTIDLE